MEVKYLKKVDSVKIPVTVEGMGEQFKNLADRYVGGEITYTQALADLNFLKSRRQDLFVSALTVRWVGKKRLKLLESIIGDVQLSVE